jgi:hypothetical protein
VVASIGGIAAAFAYDQELAFNNLWQFFPWGWSVLPTGVLRLYPWFEGSAWRAAAVFGTGSALLIAALIVLRVQSRPRLGGHFIWVAVGLAGIGIALNLFGIALDATTITNPTGGLMAYFGLFVVFWSLPSLIAGSVVSATDRFSNRWWPRRAAEPGNAEG